jgi:hypothetical protein
MYIKVFYPWGTLGPMDVALGYATSTSINIKGEIELKGNNQLGFIHKFIP